MTPSSQSGYTFATVTPATLDTYAAFVKVQDRAALEARLADGRTTYAQLWLMHSGRGLEAAWAQGAGPVLFPHVRADLPTAGLAALAGQLARTAGGKRVILNEGMAPLDPEAWRAAGWVLDTHAVMARTDLSAGHWPLDPRVGERPVAELLAADLLALYAELAKVGPLGDTGETDPALAFADDLTDESKRLFVLLENGVVLGAAVLTPGPHGAGIHLLGIRPDRRGMGLGRALHGHLLAVAAQTHAGHVGPTDYGNLAMRRILERNGAALSEQQWVRPG